MDIHAGGKDKDVCAENIGTKTVYTEVSAFFSCTVVFFLRKKKEKKGLI